MGHAGPCQPPVFSSFPFTPCIQTNCFNFIILRDPLAQKTNKQANKKYRRIFLNEILFPLNSTSPSTVPLRGIMVCRVWLSPKVYLTGTGGLYPQHPPFKHPLFALHTQRKAASRLAGPIRERNPEAWGLSAPVGPARKHVVGQAAPSSSQGKWCWAVRRDAGGRMWDAQPAP